jgi:hypothetical protein
MLSHGVSLDEMVDWQYSGWAHFIAKYGLFERVRFSKKVQEVPPGVYARLTQLPDETKETIYAFPSGRVGTVASETRQSVPEIRPPTGTGAVAATVGLAITGHYDPRIQAVGDAAEGVAAGVAVAVEARAAHGALNAATPSQRPDVTLENHPDAVPVDETVAPPEPGPGPTTAPQLPEEGGVALGKDIAGGGMKALAEQTKSSWYRNWAKAGITRRTVTNNFGRAFHDAVERAPVIRFSLDGIEDVDAAVKAGRAGFIKDNMTNAELEYLSRNPELLAKTIFYRTNSSTGIVERVPSSF